MRALLHQASLLSPDAYLAHCDTLDRVNDLKMFGYNDYFARDCWVRRTSNHVMAYQVVGEAQVSGYSIVAVNRKTRVAFGVLCGTTDLGEHYEWDDAGSFLPEDKLFPVFVALRTLVEKKEGQMEEEEQVFVPDQKVMADLMERETKELEQVTERRLKQQAELMRAKKQLEALRYEKQLIDGAKEGFVLYIERQRMRRQPVWWAVLVLVSLVFFLGQWDIGRRSDSFFNYHIALALLNFIAHKLLWRRMYVSVNTTSQFVAILILIYTFWMG
jgi:hypothetical protein